MKRIVCFLMAFSLAVVSAFGNSTQAQHKVPASEKISLLCPSSLMPLARKWADEYMRQNTGVTVGIEETSGQVTPELLAGRNIAAIIPDYTPAENNAVFPFRVVVGRDIFVPVLNKDNPFMSYLSEHGVSAGSLSAIASGKDAASWATLTDKKTDESLRFFIPADGEALRNISMFLNTSLTPDNRMLVADGKTIIREVQKDKFAAGFVRLSDISDQQSGNLIPGIALLPIDRNENGVIDFSENIFSGYSSFVRGVWIGKYPKTLVSGICTVSGSAVPEEKTAAFIGWIISDGQKLLAGTGYSELLAVEKQSATARLAAINAVVPEPAAASYLLRTVLFVLAVALVAIIIAAVILRTKARKHIPSAGPAGVESHFTGEKDLTVPAGLYFDKTHTWAFMDRDGEVTMGIDDFLQHVTGPITSVRMKEPGSRVRRGEPVLSIVQNGKQLHLYAPVSGTISEQNTLLLDNSEAVNKSPYDKGWIYKIVPEDWNSEHNLLFMGSRQREFLKNEFERLRDFIASAINGGTELAGPVVLQDGGEFRDGVLEEFGPEVWEDFQTNFIDPLRQVWFYELF